ncbi:putative membrane protein [Porphyrobacter sp. MBR-155]|jgi:uncharacterized membrane protein|uniref:COG3650 family protein n=1 Tax=Porphyrobacter sp. MBR-155 TaxID=3156464 RepID=UPI0033910218
MTIHQVSFPVTAALLMGLTACSPAKQTIDPAGETFAAVAPDEVITLTGTEPFWGVRISGGQANYANPDHPEGYDFAVERFAGNNGLGFSGTMEGAAVTITLTPGACSDGMSDRTYPYVATIALGDETLRGCGYTDRQPFTGDAAP